MRFAPYFGSIRNTELWKKLRPYLGEEYPCVVCGSRDFELWARLGYLEAKRCLKCDMKSVNPHFTEEGLRLFYKNYFTQRQEDTVLKPMREQAYILDRDWVSLFAKGGSVLDVGCSGGFFLSKFSPDVWERHGVDITDDVAAFAKREFNIPVQVGDVTRLEFDRTFDLVMLRGTIEHTSNPVAVLKKCTQLIKKGGYLFMTAMPAGDSFAFDVYREKWHLFTPLEHIHFFSVKLLSRILNEHGLKIVTHHYQYEETPYADPKNDYRKIREDIVKIAQGYKQGIESSVSFPGSMITALWQKA